MVLATSVHLSTTRMRAISDKLCLALGLVVTNLVVIIAASSQRYIELKMPDVAPTHDESYLCTAKRMNLTDNEYIVSFQPEASAAKVHHILIYGCSKPGRYVRDTPNFVWECGEMNLGGERPDDMRPTIYEEGHVCGSGMTTILFGWALDAPAIDLPPEVGFKIGGDSGINYLVLQVHYGNTAIFKNNPDLTDNSGIVLNTVMGPDNGITKLAGIYLLLSYGYVEEGISRHQMQCLFRENKVIHPFRFRTHTHKLGVKVGGSVKQSGSNEEILIGEHDPQQPQMFYPVANESLTIGIGDTVSAYCDYNNDRKKIVMIGATNNDEMCNFYIMYWIEGNSLLSNQDCMQYNP